MTIIPNSFRARGRFECANWFLINRHDRKRDKWHLGMYRRQGFLTQSSNLFYFVFYIVITSIGFEPHRRATTTANCSELIYRTPRRCCRAKCKRGNVLMRTERLSAQRLWKFESSGFYIPKPDEVYSTLFELIRSSAYIKGCFYARLASSHH